MKSLKNIILEGIHKGSMHIEEIIRVLHKEYNLTHFNAKDHPEVGKFLPYSKIDDLDVARTMADTRCGIGISASKTPGRFGLGLHYISTEKSKYGDGTLRRELDWIDMSKDTLQNLVICLRKVLSQFEDKMVEEYTKHPKAKDLRSAIQSFVSRQTPRNFYLRDINVGVTVRELTNDDKKEGFSCIIDVELIPNKPQRRLSIGIDKNDCLRWVQQVTYGDCKEGLLTPQHLIKWEQVEGQVATMLQSY
jgi:hypothetical protein